MNPILAYLNRNSQKAYVGVIAFSCFFVWIYVATIFHEGGHAAVCYDTGGVPKQVSFNEVDCTWSTADSSGYLTGFRFAGGAVGAMFSLIPVAFLDKRFRNNANFRGFAIALLTIAFFEFEESIMEGSNFAFYNSQTGKAAALIGMIAAGFVFFDLLTCSKQIVGGWIGESKKKRQGRLPL